LGFAHEALPGCADERDRLWKEDAHRVSQSDGLLVGPAFDLYLAECGARQLDGGVQRQRRKLLALSLGDRLGLARRELLQALHQVFGIAAERESKSSAFHRRNDTRAYSSG